VNGTGDFHVRQRKSVSEEQRSHVFPHMWKPVLEDKCIFKWSYVYIYIYIYIYIHSQKERERECDCNSGACLRGLWEGEGSKREWERVNLYEDNIMKCTVNCWIIGEQGERERVSNSGELIQFFLFLQCEIPRWNPLNKQYTFKKWRTGR
jgi:hypothetical protein